MILVRNLFRVKFGQAKPAVAAFQEVRAIMRQSGLKSSRLLTDLVGASCALVHEIEFESLTAFEQEMKKITSSSEWRSTLSDLCRIANQGPEKYSTLLIETSSQSQKILSIFNAA